MRELTDVTGAIRARYDYDPYGNRTKISGDLDASFGYTGHYFHAPSSMNLALNRVYDSMTGRWLTRDPLDNAEMSQGANLYAYLNNNPINNTDPLGLCPGDWRDLLYQFMLGSEEGAYAAIDGFIPFWDPFADRYNPNDPGIGFSLWAGGLSRNLLLAAAGAEAWNAAGLPSFQVGVTAEPIHVFYGVTEGGTTTFLHAAGASGEIETTIAPGLAGYGGYWNTLTGIPIIAPAAAAAQGIPATNCATGACGALLRGWGL